MVSNTQRMTSCLKKNRISQMIETNFYQKQNYLAFFDVIETKPVDILFEQKNDKIK